MGTRAKKAQLTRPVKALTRFQRQIIKAIDFSQLDPSELSTYLYYEVARDIARQEKHRRSQRKEFKYTVHGLLKHPSSPKVPMEFGDIPLTQALGDDDWLASRVQLIRQAYHVTKFVVRIPGNPLWFLYPGTRVLVLWPEWPDKPYLEIPRDERLRRVQTFFTPAQEDQLAARAYLLNPHHPTTVKIATVTVAILDKRSASGQEQLDAYKAELQLHAPKLFQPSPSKSVVAKRQGRGAQKVKISDNLHCYAAYLLYTVAKIPSTRAIDLICRPSKGGETKSRVYGTANKLADAARRFPKRLQTFRHDLVANLIPLGPALIPLETSLPDGSQLEAAVAANPEPWRGSKEALEALEALDHSDLDPKTRKTLGDEIRESIARLDKVLRRIGVVEDRSTLNRI